MTEDETRLPEMTGRCLCGAVGFTASDVEPGHHACHCEMCRRWGSGPYMGARAAAMRFVGGEHLATYASSEWAERAFCTKCGSNLYYRLKSGGDYYVSVGAFDDPTPFTVIGEIFIDAKPRGYDLAGDHPRLTEKQVLEKFGIG